jgi:hypothetical protein
MSHTSNRHCLASAWAVLFTLWAGNAAAQAVDCSLDTDPDVKIDLKIFDTLDDFRDGILTGPLVRTCPDSSPTPHASYTLSASAGSLRAVRTYKGTPMHAITTTASDGVLRMDGFPPNINSFGVTAYGSDVDGKYVPRSHLIVTLYAADGSVIDSRPFPGATRHYSLGGTWNVPLGAVEIKMQEKQPHVDKMVFPTIEAFTVAHDYGVMP